MARRVGVWVFGACGAVSTCAIAGAEALKAGAIGRTGLVTELPEFRGLGLCGIDELVFGGHEVRATDLVRSAGEFARDNGVLTPAVLEAAREGLVRASANLRPGVTLNCGQGVQSLGPAATEKDGLSLVGIVRAIQRDLAEFRRNHALDDVVVVHLTSAEPHRVPPREFHYLESFQALLEADRRDLFPASVLYAYAAIDAGCPYVNFTTCLGSGIPALDALARLRGVPHTGRDAKTGETLLKTTLAPMFVARNLQVLSWEGYNMLGNRDGLVLDQPDANRAKVQDKDGALRQILKDDAVHSRVRIDYVPSLGDWKTAWDFIHFAGFMGTRMTMQFTWQGCDSALAAPLVLDLVRFAELAHRSNESGIMRHLSCFFKAPYEATEHDFHRQNQALLDYAQARASSAGRVPAPA